jgi:acetyl esterase/lipase
VLRAVKTTLHAYGEHRDQHAELRLPDGPAPHPVALLIHGGFWRDRYDRRLMDRLCDDLVRAGWATWNVEYRRLPKAGWPRLFDDVAAAIDLLAGVPSADTARVTAIGHSAGGHLALWAAARPRLPAGAPGARPQVRIAGAVSQAGVADLALGARLGLSNGVVADLLGGGPEEVPERYAAASPAELVPLGIPQLLVHGARDEIVPPQVSHAYAERARGAGDHVELQLIAGEAHFEHLDPGSACWRAVRDWLEGEC